MAGETLVRTRTDEFGVPISTAPPSPPMGVGYFGITPPPTAPAAVTGVGGLVRNASTAIGAWNPDRQRQLELQQGVDAELARQDDLNSSTGLPGSPMKTLYGVDSESYLTDDQRKLARQIQGKFDQSVGFRDRELQRYGAPRLASFTEDESLARAMSLARGLNAPPEAPAEPTGYPFPRTQSPLPRPAAAAPPPPPTVPRDRYAEWAKVISGLVSIAPLLFGKTAFNEFINKGAIKSVLDWIKGITGSDYSPEQLQQMIGGGVEGGGAYPTQAATDWWNQNMAPWGTSAEGGLPYPTPDTSSLNINDFSDFYGGAGSGAVDPSLDWAFSSLGGP